MYIDSYSRGIVSRFTKKSLNQTIPLMASPFNKRNGTKEFLSSFPWTTLDASSTNSTPPGMKAIYKNDTGMMMAYQYIQRQIDAQNITLVCIVS